MATIPAGSGSEIAFISGVDSSDLVAGASYWGWNRDAPATYGGGANNDQTRAFKWGSTSLQPAGTPANITFAFDTLNGSNWSQAEQNALASGLHLWAAEANITFTLTADEANANILFQRTPSDGKANTSPQALGPTVGSQTTGAATQKIIHIDTTTKAFGPIGDPSAAISFAYGGGKAYDTILHEEGHALGLGHGGPYNQGDGLGSVQSRQFSIYDNQQYSIMSYINPMDPAATYFGNPNYSAAGTIWGTVPSTGIGGFGLPDPILPNVLWTGISTTPMMLDILAMQRLYGTPISGPLVSGSQVFGFNTNIAGDVGDYFNFSINQNPILTLWDSGFGNTLDLSGFTTSSTINLTPGKFTSTDGMKNNIGIAPDTWIDTAIGSQGTNTINGNDHSNTLTGGPLADKLSGNGGDDTLRGGAGGDKLDGGTGLNNTATYDTAPSGLTANLANPLLNTGDAKSDTYTSIQDLVGSAFNDVLVGNASDNVIHGGAGDDQIHGGGGHDILDGDGDNDTLYAGGAHTNAGNGYFGGSGVDTVDYSSALSLFAVTGLILDLKFPNFNTGAAFGDLYDSIENLAGTNKSDDLRGDDGPNTIKGLSGNDILQGRGGFDTLVGGVGDDIYHLDDVSRPSNFSVSAEFDSVQENPNEGTDTVLVSPLGRFNVITSTTSYSYTLPANVEIGTIVDISSNHDFDLTGNELANTLTGNSFNNTLSGMANNDILNGGAGHDVLKGGAGDDTYVLADVASGPNIAGVAFDSVQENADEGIDTVLVTPLGIGITGSTFFYALPDNVENGVITGSGDFELDGNGLANTLTGNSANSTLKGMGGDDILRGAAGIPVGHDTLDGGPGSDTADLTGFTISKFFHALQLDGDNPVNVPGAFIGAGITEGTQTLISIENLWGSVRAEDFVGDDRDNTFRGGGGADILDGGGGNNTVDYSDKIQSVALTLAGSTQVSVMVGGVIEDKISNFQNVIGGAKGDTLNGDDNPNHIQGNGGDDTLHGGAGADTLEGGDGKDVLQGGAGPDFLDGGGDLDLADYSDKTVAVVADLSSIPPHDPGVFELIIVTVGGADEDTITNIEGFIGGSAGDTFIGDGGSNLFYGGGGDDFLQGGGGADVLDGNGGNDTADYSDKNLAVVVALRAPNMATIVKVGGVSEDTLYRIENINGGSAGDTLTGNDVANTLHGLAGNDIIKGGGGADILDGGQDTDTVDYSDKSAAVVLTLNGATPTTVTVGGVAEDQISNFENVIGGAAGDHLTGDSGANDLDGGLGADTMIGLGGNDTYHVDNMLDVVTEAVGGGSDHVLTSVSYTLGAGQEIEFLASTLSVANRPGASGLTLTGNEFSQTITGDGRDDVLDGKGNADTMIGLGGNDTYRVDNGGDVVVEATSGGTQDQVLASVSYTLQNGQEIETLRTDNDTGIGAINLTGNEFANTVVGNAGDNMINGGAGNDKLTGLGGHDTFVFSNALDPVNNVDSITDLSVANDKISLSQAVFTALSGSLQSQQFFIGAAAHNSDDRIIYNPDTGALIYDSNGNGEGGGTQFATLAHHLALTNTNFIIS